VIFEEFSAHVKKITIGKHLPTAIYLHIDAIDEIPLVLKHFIIQTVMPIPGIVIVAPPRLEQPLGSMAPKFEGAGEKSEGLSGALQQVAIETGCHFFDAGSVTTTSRVDGVHLVGTDDFVSLPTMKNVQSNKALHNEYTPAVLVGLRHRSVPMGIR